MVSYVRHRNIPIEFIPFRKLYGVIQRRGNKARALSTMFHLLILMKQVVNKKPSFSIEGDKITSIDYLNQCLTHLSPGFLLTPIRKAGLLYKIPVTISENHALYTASQWLRIGALSTKDSPLSLAQRIFNEIQSSLIGKGTAISYLQKTIDIALDQRPFSGLLHRKRKVVSRSRKTRAARKLFKVYKRHNWLAFKTKRRLNYHITRAYHRQSYRYRMLYQRQYRYRVKRQINFRIRKRYKHRKWYGKRKFQFK